MSSTGAWVSHKDFVPSLSVFIRKRIQMLKKYLCEKKEYLCISFSFSRCGLPHLGFLPCSILAISWLWQVSYKIIASQGISEVLAKHSTAKAFENPMHLQHLNECSIIIKTIPLVMNICNQGQICWDGCITKVILCLACIFLGSCYHCICTIWRFLQISYQKNKSKIWNNMWEEMSSELIILFKSHMQQGEAALYNASLFTECMHTE